jgi:hypothetical protein
MAVSCEQSLLYVGLEVGGCKPVLWYVSCLCETWRKASADFDVLMQVSSSDATRHPILLLVSLALHRLVNTFDLLKVT